MPAVYRQGRSRPPGRKASPAPGAATQLSLETLLETRLEPSPAPPGDASLEWPDELQALQGASSPEVREQSLDAALHGERLDKALVSLAPEFSRSHLQGLLARGHVLLDGARADTASRRVRAGQCLRVELVPTDESRAFRPQPLPLRVLHEDEHLLVLDKPAGLVVHPGPGNWSGTLLNALLARHPVAVQLPRAGIVHRLDKDTSGVMMVGKSLPAVTALVRDIAERSVQRRYLAIAHAAAACRGGAEWAATGQDGFRVEAPIGRDPRVRVRMAVVGVAAGGKPARTDVRVLARAEGLAALACQLHTGRTHQIRVHLASQGWPLVADSLYGGRAALGLQRQALHAHSLVLDHPVTRQRLQFDCPPPQDFAAAWAQLTTS